MSDLSAGFDELLIAETRAAAFAALHRSFEADPTLPIDQWADEHAFIPKDTGANEPGKYRVDRTPHARAVMQWLSPDHPSKRVVVMGASQMLKTQVALNFLCASVHQNPSNFLWIVPTGTLVKRASGRIDKTFRATPALAGRIATKRDRDASNNLTTKEFQGGTLHILTAGAAANLSEVSARFLVYDEIDRSDDNVQGEGAPWMLAETRQTTFETNRKAYYPSSPTIEGESMIGALFARGTQREALAECIHCGHGQPLDFFRLIRGDDGHALYPCTECGGIHVEADKERMFRAGLWSAGVAGDGETESATISQMFLPYGWFPWTRLMDLYESAQRLFELGDESEMIAFYNTRLARTWERSKEQPKWEELRARAEPYPLGTVPDAACVLTASFDCQATYLQYLVIGWGPGLESWVVDRGTIEGSPTDPETWIQADEILTAAYPHEAGGTLPILAAFVDSGGADGTTQEVYNFCRNRRYRHVYAVKGASKPNRPIISAKPTIVDVTYSGSTEKDGCKLWFVGGDTARDYLVPRYSRASGPGALHFSDELPDEFYQQLTAEFVTYIYRRGRKVRVWEKKKHDRNEDGDLMVYNLGVAHLLKLHTLTHQRWQTQRKRAIVRAPVTPIRTQSQESTPVQEPPQAPAPRRARRRGGLGGGRGPWE